MSKHTPGPWLRDGKTVYALNAKNFNRFCAQVQDSHTPDGELVCVAALMQASPDMLDVLDMYSLPLTGDYRLDCAEFGAYAVMRENARRLAVKKARGEQ